MNEHQRKIAARSVAHASARHVRGTHKQCTIWRQSLHTRRLDKDVDQSLFDLVELVNLEKEWLATRAGACNGAEQLPLNSATNSHGDQGEARFSKPSGDAWEWGKGHSVSNQDDRARFNA